MRAFVAGALISTVLAVLGTVLVAVALTVVVVGAPVVAAVIAYALVPHVKSSPAASRLVNLRSGRAGEGPLGACRSNLPAVTRSP